MRWVVGIDLRPLSAGAVRFCTWLRETSPRPCTPREGTFRVIATSVADPTRSAAATVKSSWGNLQDFGGRVVPDGKAVAIWWGDRNAFRPTLATAWRRCSPD
jgi:hypothetical protein